MKAIEVPVQKKSTGMDWKGEGFNQSLEDESTSSLFGRRRKKVSCEWTYRRMRSEQYLSNN